MQQQQDQQQVVPDWSGEFWASADGDFGYMAIWIGDEEGHRPPTGWRLMRHWFDEDADADVYEYRHVSSWCMAG